jgi:molybdenum cofactor cytidylyltransferase
MKAKKIAAVILAAGGSSRLGRPKQLLDWFGKPFIKQLIDITLKAELDPVIVVTGSSHEEVVQAIKDEKVVIVRNEKWKSGQSSSMQAGCKTLKNYDVDAFIIFLCDQPQVPLELINTIRLAAQDDEFDIIATSVNDRICPPTLFKTGCIDGIMSLTGDQGGKALFNSYKTQIFNWKDERLLQDSDTEADYLILKKLYT